MQGDRETFPKLRLNFHPAQNDFRNSAACGVRITLSPITFERNIPVEPHAVVLSLERRPSGTIQLLPSMCMTRQSNASCHVTYGMSSRAR